MHNIYVALVICEKNKMKGNKKKTVCLRNVAVTLVLHKASNKNNQTEELKFTARKYFFFLNINFHPVWLHTRLHAKSAVWGAAKGSKPQQSRWAGLFSLVRPNNLSSREQTINGGKFIRATAVHLTPHCSDSQPPQTGNVPPIPPWWVSATAWSSSVIHQFRWVKDKANNYEVKGREFIHHHFWLQIKEDEQILKLSRVTLCSKVVHLEGGWRKCKSQNLTNFNTPKK